MKTILLLVVLLVAFAATSFAQADNTDFGLWNDIQVSKAVNKQVDVIGGLRFDTKHDSARFAEERVYGGLNFKSKDSRLTVQTWLIFLKNFARTPYYEVRPQVTIGYKFTTKNKVNITPRVRLEYHMKHNVKDDGRVVPILAFDKKLSKHYGVFQTTEVWFPVKNDLDTAKYRQRYFFGVTRTFNKNLSVDFFYLYQRDTVVNPKNTSKLGMTWKIRL